MTPAVDSAREDVLTHLRQSLAGSGSPFRRDASVPPEVPMTVTHAEGDGQTLAAMFGAKLEELQGSFEMVDRASDVADRIIDRIRRQEAESDEQDGNPPPVLAWAADEIPVPGLEQRLTESGIDILVPSDLHDRKLRARAARATTGITGVDAAFASTGSVMLASGPGKSRAASLLPLHHLVVVPITKIYPTFEHWLRSLRQLKRLETLLRENGQISFVTGPSKSADIELNLTLGVHGPKTVHAIVFDDS